MNGVRIFDICELRKLIIVGGVGIVDCEGGNRVLVLDMGRGKQASRALPILQCTSHFSNVNIIQPIKNPWGPLVPSMRQSLGASWCLWGPPGEPLVGPLGAKWARPGPNRGQKRSQSGPKCDPKCHKIEGGNSE